MQKTKEDFYNKVIHGDCLVEMVNLPDESIDLIITDLPFKVTHNSWDKELIPFDQLWQQYNRIIKQNGAILLYANGSFIYKVIDSNPKFYKYNYVWLKNNCTNFQNAKKQPMRRHEQILVFYKKQPTYNPQNLKPFTKNRERHNEKIGDSFRCKSLMTNYIQEFTNYPYDVLKFDRDKVNIHPTQKPIALNEYLIKTFSNEGDLILDSCAGAGSTGLACKNTNRNYILIEKEKKYFDIMKERGL